MQPAPKPPEQSSETINVRFEFVEMLFALAVAEIATQVAHVVAAPGPPSSLAWAYSHLTVVTILVATSWVGWTTSKAAGAPGSSTNRRRVERVFSWEFVVLLIDVALVICYYIIANDIEHLLPKEGGKTIPKPSARTETFWITVVYAFYIVWDFVTKALMVKPDDPLLAFRSRFDKEFLPRVWPSILCCILAGLLYYCCRNITSNWNLVLVDVALLLLELLFRALKQYFPKTRGVAT